MKYNTTEISVNSFTGLMETANGFMGGGLGYGMIFIFWMISMTVLSNYPNIDALKSSTYISWIASILLSVFGIVDPTFPMVMFFLVAGLAASEYVKE